MNSFSQIRSKVDQELENLRKQKSLLQTEVKTLSENNNTENLRNEFDNFYNQSSSSLSDLIQGSIKIKSEVADIGEISDKTLKSFETLKYRKSNVEKILNTLTAILELNKIVEPYSKAVETKNYDDCVKYIRQYKNIENCINEEITPHDIRKFKQISTTLASSLRSEFEKSIAENNTEIINKISTMFFLLNIEDNTFDKVINVYEKKLEENLEKFIDKLDKEKANGTNFKSIENYKFNFYSLFVDYLSVLFNIINTYKDNIIEHFELPGLLHMVEKLVNFKSDLFIQQKFFPVMQNFFDLNSQMLKNIMNKIPIDDSIDLNGCLAQGASLVGKYLDHIQALQIFCEEISDISNQCELFKKHIFKIMFTEGNSDILRKAREHDKNDQSFYTKKLDNLMMNKSIMEGLDKFFYYQRFILKFQIIHIVQTSQVIKSTWNYEKAFFFDFNNMSEEIGEQTKLFEYLDDFFYLMKNSASKALSTRNKSIACAFLNYLTNTIIGEDLVKIVNDVFNRYIKKEFFTGSMMCFSPTNNVYNTIMIVLFNNAERILTYLKNLKETMLDDYNKLYSEDKENEMILHSIEEMENQNVRTFTGILDEKFKYFTEYLKNTIRPDLEKIKEISFQFHENQMKENEEKFKYSQNLKNKLGPAMVQWTKQLSKTNFERFITCFCDTMARSLEGLVLSKKYYNIGAFLIDTEIRGVITFLQTLTNINVKKKFSKISLICEMLTLETKDEIEEFAKSYSAEISQEDLRIVLERRTDIRR